MPLMPLIPLMPPLPQELGNSLDKCKNNENLQQILTNATIMVVSVTASTTQGCVPGGPSRRPSVVGPRGTGVVSGGRVAALPRVRRAPPAGQALGPGSPALGSQPPPRACGPQGCSGGQACN